MKPYKSAPPASTINKIRNALDSVSIFLREQSFCSNRSLYTTRVTVSSGMLDDLDIGTNGKGVSYQYALASGYAEFMERLQNGILFRGYKNATRRFLGKLPEGIYKKQLISDNIVLDFLYDAHEKCLTVEEVVEKNIDFLKNLFPFVKDVKSATAFISNDLGFDSLICVPFFSDKNGEERYLPIELIEVACGSNGMASGNTRAEALIQGFCEIFERYAGYSIYWNNLTPPTIPLEEFKEYRVYELVQELLKKNDYELTVKDCSLGIGIPVVGVLVIDKRKGKYNFNLGSALNPGVALERCLTELYQSADGLSWYDIKYENFSGNKSFSKNFIYLNGNRLFTDGEGFWPLSLFGSVSSYEYKGLNKSLDVSDKEDISFIRQKINSIGFNIYIRDVSFLGFDSYYIVVPGMSQFPIEKDHYSILSDSYRVLHLIRNINKVSQKEIKEMCNQLNSDYDNLKLQGFNFNDLIPYHTDYDLRDLDMELLLFMLNYRIGDWGNALKFLSKFLEGKNFESYRYYYGLHDYLKLKMQKKGQNYVKDSLLPLYRDIVDEIADDMEPKDQIMRYFKFPTCFKCEECGIKQHCCHIEMLKILKKVQTRSSQYHPDYKNFKYY